VSYTFLIMADQVRIERLIRILQLLSSGREITVQYLHKYFDKQVSLRTLQRDLVDLSSANIPLVTRSGKGKQLIWAVDPGYLRFIPQLLKPREVVVASLLKQLMQCFLGTALEDEARAFFEKARQLYPPSAVIETSADAPSKLVGFSKTGYIDYQPVAHIIRSLLEAISGRFIVLVEYKAIGETKHKMLEVHPYLILHHKGALYLLGLHTRRGVYVSLPIHRMKSAKATARQFKKPSDFDWQKVFKDRLGIFGIEDSKPVKVVLNFDARIAEVVAERVWHPSQKLTRHRDGSLTMELKVVISDELRSWVAGWLDYVTVARPVNLMEGTSD